MSLTMTVDQSGIPPWQKFSWSEAGAIWSRQAGPMGLALMRAQTPVGAGPTAGHLRQTTSSRAEIQPGAVMITYYATAPYAKYPLYGTQPHVIAVRNARALRWLANRGHGPVMFATRVNHPGNKPDPWPERAMQLAGPAAAHLFAEAVKESMEL